MKNINDEPHEQAKVMLSTDVEAAPEEVIALVLDFEGLHRWHPGIENFQCEGNDVGAIRSYTFGGNPYRERLDAREPDHGAIRYTVLEGPLPIGEVDCRYQVSDNGESGAKIRWRADFFIGETMKDPMAQAVGLLQTATLELLKVRCETGQDLVAE